MMLQWRRVISIVVGPRGDHIDKTQQTRANYSLHISNIGVGVGAGVIALIRHSRAYELVLTVTN